MRLEINAGGLGSFYTGVSSFCTSNNASSNALISGFQTVINKTNSISGGAAALSVALEYIQTRKVAEETRKTAIETVTIQTDIFVQTASRVDAAVAQMVSSSQEAFYQTNPWLRPPTPPSLWDSICIGAERFWNGVTEVWNGIVDFVKEHWVEILIGIAAVALGALLQRLPEERSCRLCWRV